MKYVYFLYRLTAVSWGSYRPTVLILTRTDGTVELWDFQVKTDSPCVTQSLSGRIITGIYPHDLRLDPQCIGFCDFNGILRMFLSPGDFLKVDLSDMEWMKNFIQHQVARVNLFFYIIFKSIYIFYVILYYFINNNINN